MKNRTIVFAALAVLFLGFFLCGCMTPQKAISYLERKGNLPEVCADHYPVVDSAGKTTVIYKPADNIDHTKQLDSLKDDFDRQLQAFKDAQQEQAHDTGCVRTIQELQRQYENLATLYDNLWAKYKPCKPDTAFIDRDIYHDTNPAKTAALQQQLTISQADLQKATPWKSRAIWTWVVIGGVLIGGGILKSIL